MLTQISIIIWTFLTISQVCRGATIVETPLGHIEGQILRYNFLIIIGYDLRPVFKPNARV
jgi:hypothetical protein